MATSEIAEAFERTCRDHRADKALLWLPDARALTFGELHEHYGIIRGALRRHGVESGACVVSLLGNHPTFFPLVAACMDAGTALLPLGEATDAEAAAIIGNAGASAVVTHRSLPLGVADSSLIDDGVSILRLPDQASSRSYGQSLVIKLTSGSTELPKATLTGERALVNDARSIAAGMAIAADDVNLAMIPLSHAYAISNIVTPLLLQGTGAALRPSFSPAQFLQDAQLSAATVFPGVPFMFDRLRSVLEHEPLPAALRTLITAGARIDPDTVRWFHDHALRKIHSFYGASETGGITFDETDEVSDPLHVGRPLPGVQVDILPEPGVEAAGRVFVRSQGMASGYATTPTAEVDAGFRHGGFLTSDLGYLNPGNQLVLTGRVSPLVNVAGRKVDPAEVERVLVALPDVTDARVVGIDCQTRGQELVAFVLRADPSLTPLALRRACAATLSPYKIPRRFIFLDSWPADGRGKVDRRALEALASDT